MLATTPADEPVTVAPPRAGARAGDGAAGVAVEVSRARAAAVLAVDVPLAEPPHPVTAGSVSTDAATRAERLRACIANSFDVRAADSLGFRWTRTAVAPGPLSSPGSR